MSRRSIKFNVHVAGNPTYLLMADWIKVAGKEYPQQSLIYSNSAKACDETLIPRLISTAWEKIPFSPWCLSSSYWTVRNNDEMVFDGCILRGNR
jgi:hypothetical protein